MVFNISFQEHGFKDILDDFTNAKEIYITTYNISQEQTQLLSELHKLNEDVSVTFITNIPSRFKSYFKSYQTRTPAMKARDSIKKYFEQLDRAKFNCNLTVYFCYHNHTKIVMTENIAYIGSANFSDESKDNFEAGIIVKERQLLKDIKNQVISKLIPNSVRYTTSLYTIYMEYVNGWLTECRDFFNHFDMGIFTMAEVRYTHEEKVIDFNNAYISNDRLNKFLQMIDKAEELIEVMIIDEFEDLVNEERLRKSIDLLRTQTEKFSDYINDLAEFNRNELQIKYAQELDEYWTGDGDDLNYAFESAGNRVHEELTEITEQYIGLQGYFERVQVRIPKLLGMVSNEVEQLRDILNKEHVYENKDQINNTGLKL